MNTFRRRARTLCIAGVTLTLLACETDPPLATAPHGLNTLNASSPSAELIATVRRLAIERGIGELEPPAHIRRPLVRLGQMLVFDKELSGNRDISCMTCHLPSFATGDGRSLAVGQGATGLGPERIHPDGAFIPRNAPPLFNLSGLGPLFWDGRVSVDASGTFHTPAGAQLTPDMTAVFEFGSISALGLFPVLSREEMRATSGNELAALADDARADIWRALMARLGEIREYRQLFEVAYLGTRFEDMTFAHASNAMAAFFLSELSLTDSPWDRFLRGHDRALDEAQLIGARTFLSIRCSLCHNGPGLTDNQFHNVAVAQFGPGKGDGPDGRDDFGRMRVTGLATDRYRFRTTPLRNVALTGPYGHDGAFTDLRAFIAHYSESDVKLRTFDPSALEPLLRGTLLPTAEGILATRDAILDGVVLPDAIVGELMSFMGALTDPRAGDLHRVIPSRVPSGLTIDGGR